MVKFSIPAVALAIGAGVSSTTAFAPVATTSRSAAVVSSSSAPLHMSSVAAPEQSPLAPLTVWGDRIPDIIESQNEAKSRNMEFAPTIKSSDLGLASNDVKGQLTYVKEHAMEIKQQMVDNGAVIFREFDLMKEQEGF